MSARKIEDYLREEYFALLPQVRQTAEELEAEVRHLLIPFTRGRESHERLIVKSRIKECESAIESLRRRENWFGLSEADRAAPSLKTLNDLAGVRILAFPKYRVLEIDEALRSRFCDWVADPVFAANGTAGSLALKYHGYCGDHCKVRAELQLMSMLVGLFWEVEHGALYKPSERLRGMQVSLRMQERNADVIRALTAFEAHFESIVCVKPSATEESLKH